MTTGACRATTLPKVAMAFLGALAIGESDPHCTGSDQVYSTLFGGGFFATTDGELRIFPKGRKWPFVTPLTTWPQSFPQWDGMWIQGVPTHAAGRYQFEPATAKMQMTKLGVRDFSPVSQDIMAWDLAETVISRIGGGANLQTWLVQGGVFPIIALELLSTWSSLDPATLEERFNQCLSMS